MLTGHVDEESRNVFWPRVREFAVPPSMIATATARRLAGDWAGACAAARVDVDLRVRSVARSHGHEVAARLRDDLRHLAPDLLRWHLPRIAPDGLLRPGLTVALARYGTAARDGTGALWLVARTVPAWADSGQRISLAVWDPARTTDTARQPPHPHPRPQPRFRLDLHRHLWDARRAHELAARSASGTVDDGVPPGGRQSAVGQWPTVEQRPAVERRPAVGRWADEARLLLRADGLPDGTAVLVRAGARHRFLVRPDGRTEPVAPGRGGGGRVPVLPDAATWEAPDVALLRAGAIDPDRLHPLVAAALVPGHVPSPAPPDRDTGPRPVACRGAEHRIALVDGVLVPLDHGPDEIRREELLAALTGAPLPCLQAIDQAHRRPDCLVDVRERLRHGDTEGALTVVEHLLGRAASLRDGALREALESAARQRLTYGLFRAGLSHPPPSPPASPARRPRVARGRPRYAQVH
ncbi:hypothetical protein AB0D49_27835 [Streptomyces sp. NPDC048290]|uniref:hypothetical protein n=1 Tax=Streptomyces sp. NPDC048290 TaxID=3155811 RepID=UPI0034211811